MFRGLRYIYVSAEMAFKSSPGEPSEAAEHEEEKKGTSLSVELKIYFIVKFDDFALFMNLVNISFGQKTGTRNWCSYSNFYPIHPYGTSCHTYAPYTI